MKVKLSYWYKFVSRFRIVRSGHEIIPHVPRENGTYVSYPFVNKVLKGVNNCPNYFYKGLIKTYYFTPREFYESDGPIVYWKELLRYLCEKHKLKIKDVTKYTEYFLGITMVDGE